MMDRALATLCAVALAGCRIYHVALPPPAPGITANERVALFHAAKPAATSQVRESNDGGRTWEVSNRTMLLSNNVEVVAPEDLAPLVATDSATMRAAHRSVAARRKASVAYALAATAVVGGFAMIGGFGEQYPWVINGWVAWPVFLGAPLIFGGVGRHYQSVELDERRSAFRSYTRDLGARLDVCARGMEVIPCEAPSPAPAPTPAR